MTVNRERRAAATNYNYNYNCSSRAATRIGSETIYID
jgi:hypothetical protein